MTTVYRRSSGAWVSYAGSVLAAPSAPSRTNRGWAPTGVTLTTYAGPSTITVANTVLDSVDILDGLTIAATNVQITRSRLRATVSYNASPFQVSSGSLVMTDCELDGAGHNDVGGGQGILGFTSYTLTRCYLHGGGDNLRMADNTTVDDCWIGDMVNASSSQHNDAIQSTSGANLIIKNSTISGNSLAGPAGAAGAWGMPIILKADQGDISSVQISGCTITGGIYGLQIRNGTGFNATGPFTITSNTFEKGSFEYGPVDLQPTGTVTSSGNRYDDGTTVVGLS